MLLKIIAHLSRALLFRLAIFGLIVAALEILSVWVLRLLFLLMIGGPDAALHMAAKSSFVLIPPEWVQSIVPLLIATFSFIVVKSLMSAVLWRSVAFDLAGEQANFAQRLFEKYLRAPYAFHIARSYTMAQHNLNVVTNQMFVQLTIPLLQTYSEALVLCALVFFMLVQSPIETMLLGLWLLIILGLFRAAVAQASYSAGRERRDNSDQMLRLVHESLIDFKSIKVWARESFFIRLFREAATSHERVLARDRFLQFLPRFILEPALIGGLVVLYVVLTTVQHADHARIIAELSLFSAASLRILPAAHRISSQVQTIAFNRADIDAVFADLNERSEIYPERPDGILSPPFEHSIALRHVTLKYGTSELSALNDISMEIFRGDKIALIGATGSGKTSFLNLLLGLLQPEQGEILIDDQAEPPLARFRSTSTALVPQDAFLLNNSVAANVAFGVPANRGDIDRIWVALRTAKLEDRVHAMPKGLNTNIGENGTALSGGERQRLAIARALYARPKFLVLDEATSQLDTETEKEILDNILDSSSDLTIVMATHRPSSATRFSRCLRIEKGQLSEVETVASHQPDKFASSK